MVSQKIMAMFMMKNISIDRRRKVIGPMGKHERAIIATIAAIKVSTNGATEAPWTKPQYEAVMAIATTNATKTESVAIRPTASDLNCGSMAREKQNAANKR